VRCHTIPIYCHTLTLTSRAGKKTIPIEELLNDADEPIDPNENTTDAADASNESASEWDMGGQGETASLLISQGEGEGGERRTTFGSTLDGQPVDPTSQENEALPEPCEELKGIPFGVGVEEDSTAPFTFRSPVKAAPVYEPYQFTENTATSPRLDQESTIQFLFRSPSKRASPIKPIQLSRPISPSVGAKQDSTIQTLFRSPNKRTSSSKRIQCNNESTPPPEIEYNIAPPKMARLSVKKATPARHIQRAVELSPTPVKKTTPARRIRLAEAPSPLPNIEHDSTIQLLFCTPRKDALPSNDLDHCEDSKYSPLPGAEGTDTLDSEMSDSVDEENTVALSKDSAVVASMNITERRTSEESPLRESEAVSQELSSSERIKSEHNFDDSIVGTEDVSQEENAYVGVSADAFTDYEENEDTEMSEITFSLDLRPSPKKPSTFKEVEAEAEALEELYEQENTLTEASLQLDLQQDVDMTEEEEITVSVEVDEFAEELEVPPTQDSIGDQDDTTIRAITSPGLNVGTEESELVSEPLAAEMLVDIADGLTLDLTTPSSAAPTPRRLRSLSPPPQEETGPDDITMTIALDDDTAILKDFLTRVAANKANKVETIARRTSLINRRDSDAVRHALASPRMILEDKDPNSPSKYDNDGTFDLTQTLTLDADQQFILSHATAQADVEGTEDFESSKSSRRSTRTRTSRLPAPASASAPQPPQGPKSIAVRRVDGTEPIVLKRTEAQELGLLTRSNTRKNKQGAFGVSLKLFSLNAEASKNKTEATSSHVANDDAEILAINPITGKKNVRWDQTLAYFQEGTDTQANMKAEAESLATPDELSLPLSTPSTKSKIKVPKDKSSNSTPKIRRIRGLGAANGTPGKGLLGTETLLPDDVVNEKEVPTPTQEIQRLPESKISRVKMPVASSAVKKVVTAPRTHTPLPPMEPAPAAPEPAKESTKISKERRSRLATPKRVRLPQPVSAPSVKVEGKENQQAKSLTSAIPKKGIPVPQVIVPSAPAVETGLPRRRARKM
jgi:hypothetical protein